MSDTESDYERWEYAVAYGSIAVVTFWFSFTYSALNPTMVEWALLTAFPVLVSLFYFTREGSPLLTWGPWAPIDDAQTDD